jgi:hypothetical protein
LQSGLDLLLLNGLTSAEIREKQFGWIDKLLLTGERNPGYYRGLILNRRRPEMDFVALRVRSLPKLIYRTIPRPMD